MHCWSLVNIYIWIYPERHWRGEPQQADWACKHKEPQHHHLQPPEPWLQHYSWGQFECNLIALIKIYCPVIIQVPFYFFTCIMFVVRAAIQEKHCQHAKSGQRVHTSCQDGLPLSRTSWRYCWIMKWLTN